MNNVNFVRECSRFLNYPSIEVYREGEKTNPSYLFYMAPIENQKITLAPVYGTPECMTEFRKIYAGAILAQIENGQICLYIDKTCEPQLRNGATVHWTGKDKNPVEVKEKVICKFVENSEDARKLYVRFFELYKEALQHQKSLQNSPVIQNNPQVPQKKVGCTIF